MRTPFRWHLRWQVAQELVTMVDRGMRRLAPATVLLDTMV